MPEKMDPRFRPFFQAAEYLNLSHEERTTYDQEMDRERDRLAENQWAHDNGRAEGRAEGHEDTARELLREGFEDEMILKVTKITSERLAELKRELDV